VRSLSAQGPTPCRGRLLAKGCEIIGQPFLKREWHLKCCLAWSCGSTALVVQSLAAFCWAPCSGNLNDINTTNFSRIARWENAPSKFESPDGLSKFSERCTACPSTGLFGRFVVQICLVSLPGSPWARYTLPCLVGLSCSAWWYQSPY